MRRLLAAGGVPEGYDAFVGKHVRLTCPGIPDAIASAAASVYDFKFDRPACKWVPWMDAMQPLSIPPGAALSDILVPTKDTAR
jgi:hypothetical protein